MNKRIGNLWVIIAVISYMLGNFLTSILCCIIYYGENILYKIEKR